MGNPIQKIIEGKKPSKLYQFFKYLVVAIVAILVAMIIFGLIFAKVYEGKFFPGIKVGNINLSKMTYTEAYDLLEANFFQLDSEGYPFEFAGQNISIMPVLSSPSDPDIAQELYRVDFDSAIDRAFTTGRGQGLLIDFVTRAKLLLVQKSFAPEVKIDRLRLKSVLSSSFDSGLKLARETSFELAEDSQVKIIPGEPGEMINYEKYIDIFENNLSSIVIEPIVLTKELYEPSISSSDIEDLIPDIEQATNRQEIAFTYPVKKAWMKETEIRQKYFDLNKFKKALQVKFDQKKQKSYLGFDEEVLVSFLDILTPEIEVKKRNAKFKIQNGRVLEFQSSREGIVVDTDKTLNYLESNLTNLDIKQFEIFTKNESADIKTSDANDLGIKEMVGVGTSSFAGSPSNRIHNIRTGATKINGLIIEPFEEFSLIEQLGDINAETGYLPELVIKGNKTIPEYGGGLCQIATTLFRASLDAGFEITERYPHAYRVSYYEPAGTDATIYEPHPDLRFKNNTGNIVLLQTKVDGTDLYFEFWGQDDGREVVVADPIIYNITKPGPTKYIETTDLEPGEVDCTESAHNGAEALLKRTVTFANGEVVDDEFYSKYRPWQAVCLVGVDPEQMQVASSTEELLD